VAIEPFQSEYPQQWKSEVQLQAEVLDIIKPLLAQLPHISLDLYRALDLASTAIIADTLGPTTTKLNLILSTDEPGGAAALYGW
jgi:hypothetical protein